jgi:hypothetical protein
MFWSGFARNAFGPQSIEERVFSKGPIFLKYQNIDRSVTKFVVARDGENLGLPEVFAHRAAGFHAVPE